MNYTEIKYLISSPNDHDGEINFNDLKEKLHLVHLPVDCEWFKLRVDNHFYVNI